MKGRALPLTLRLYRGASSAAALLAPAWLSYRVRKGKEDPARLAERRGHASMERPEGPLVWVHGASVGEVISVLPLIERLDARGFKVLLTSGTLTSSRVAQARAPEGVIHQFVPLDAKGFIARFLDYWAPDLVLLAESELWPNLIAELGRRGTPVVLVNGRLSERSARRWARLPRSARALLSRIDLCLAQSAEDGARFRALGTPRVEVCGNLKFDVPPPGVDSTELKRFGLAVGKRPVLLAASTHEGEEEIVIEAHRIISSKVKDLLTIIAPRHPERGVEVAELAEAAGLAPRQRAFDEWPDAETGIYVADTIGELGLFYRVAPVVFMGGSLVEHGGQNPIEPAKLGTVVLHGPHVWNFAAVYEALDAQEGAAEVSDAMGIARAAYALMQDSQLQGHMADAAFATITGLGGALERTLTAIEPYLIQIRLEAR
ncbi:3-deoxy-D-manno-octulosonic acid transferase [Xanthobacter autotrophicus]|uniref:3-deoxy-D-manno-octulosonic acid transferase n=1 Tax=Xanthobacter TaxID=279 RepID=UPI0024AC70A5|nr:3-deoxy-D-manno-octulosonic acid transferase [Xanthobacter autotrophicus]MDI4666432.1 3-deoxy-D-manno-octulosonic acid transferase [Xanthobacter autotrophicus]